MDKYVFILKTILHKKGTIVVYHFSIIFSTLNNF